MILLRVTSCPSRRSAVSKQDTVVPGVVQAVLALSGEVHLALRYTAVELLNGLAEWIAAHPSVLGERRRAHSGLGEAIVSA